jgi:multidrug efflux system membrane fusion protein
MTIQPNQDSVIAQTKWQPAQNRNNAFQQVGSSRRKLKIGKWVAGGALLLVLGGYWYFNHHDGAGARRPRAQAAPVHIATVQKSDMAVIERTIGTVLANETVQVTPQVQGRVQQVFFKEGQMVKKGDPLFLIDPRPFEAALAQTRGQLAKDQAALDGARRDLARFQTLRTMNAESQQVVDDEAATVAADAGIVEADQANVQTAQLNVEYTQIRSPVDGKTGPINIMPGNVISVTGTTATVNPLVTISEIEPIKISFFLPQTDLPRIQARQHAGGLVATIDQSDVGGSTFTVPVDFISNAVTGTTGTIELRATYPNADASLVPGQLVNVVVELANIAGATVVPHDALAAGPDGQYVYRISDDKAEQIPVTVLFDDSKNAAVQSELQPGDNVVTDGQLQVVPGGAVEVVKGAQAGPGDQGGNRRKGSGRRRNGGPGNAGGSDSKS